ncbi:MAG TPA: hypothetical protein VF710_08680 [Longimicrobium sp.]|jgi:hypothetical protein
MINYGEEIAYWYLRLNGFFLVTNFVVHQSSRVAHSADVDLIGIRPPHVYEEVGGQHDDWDEFLKQRLEFGRRTVGLICEVKTGRFEADELFRLDSVRYAVGRLGLVPKEEIERITTALTRQACTETVGGVLICKLLLANNYQAADRYLTHSLEAAEGFLNERVRRYPADKFGDRMFFPAGHIQHVIQQVRWDDERAGTVPKHRGARPRENK